MSTTESQSTDLVSRLRDYVNNIDDVPLRVEAAAEIERLTALVADHEEVHADHRRLVRELDVLLNGADGAAAQATLCDIVGQVAGRKRRALDVPAAPVKTPAKPAAHVPKCKPDFPFYLCPVCYPNM